MGGVYLGGLLFEILPYACFGWRGRGVMFVSFYAYDVSLHGNTE